MADLQRVVEDLDSYAGMSFIELIHCAHKWKKKCQELESKLQALQQQQPQVDDELRNQPINQ